VHDDTVGDLPLAVAALEAVDVAPAEGLHPGSLLVFAPVPGADVALHVCEVGAGEVDHRVRDRVHGALVPLRQPGDGVGREVEARPLEAAVVVGGVGVVHGRHEALVAAVDAAAVVDQEPSDGLLVEQALERVVDRASLARGGAR